MARRIRNEIIAQEVAEAFQTQNLAEEPTSGNKWAEVNGTNEQLLALRYERLALMLLAAVKQLTAKIEI